MRGFLGLLLSLLLADSAIAQNNPTPRLPPPLLDVPAAGAALGPDAVQAANDTSVPQPGAALTPESRPARVLPNPAATPPSPAIAPPADKQAAIQVLLTDLQNLSPATYDANDKLLDMLQLERLVALRNRQVEATREIALSTGAAPDSRSVQRAFALRTSIWPSTTIPVTWDVPPEVYERYRNECDWVREAVEMTWERESALRFTGWTQSEDVTTGIRIRINDEGPHCKRLGRFLDGLAAGMVLNFTFSNWCPVCAVNQKNSIQYIAVHEFGHAIGLAHEQNRQDAPTWCQQERQGSDGDWNVTVYDPESIMNYCSSKWNNDGQLTEMDKRAVRIMYGDPLGGEVRPRGAAPFPQPLRAAASREVQPTRMADKRLQPGPASPEGSVAAVEAAKPGCPCDQHKTSTAESPPVPLGNQPTTSIAAPAVNSSSANKPATAAPTLLTTTTVADSATVSKTPVKPRSKHLVTFLVSLQKLDGPRRTAEDVAATIHELGAYYNSGQAENARCRIEPPSEMAISGLLGTAVTPTTLHAKIDGAKAQITDESTVLFIFVGHGAVDANHSDTRTLILDSDIRIDRGSIVGYLRNATAARLVVFLTESCAGVSLPEKPPATIEFGPAKNLARLFEQLFVTPAGVVDIASSTFARDPASGELLADELSWCPPDGGMFGRAFVEVISNPSMELIAALDTGTGNVWPEFFCAVRSQTVANYNLFRAGIVSQCPSVDAIMEKAQATELEASRLMSQLTQRPQAFDLAGRTTRCEGDTP